MECQKYLMVKPAYKFDGKSEVSEIFSVWQIDFLGPFPLSRQGNRYVIVALEALTGYPFAQATGDQTSETVLEFLKKLMSIFGVP
ncbi:hypothetical protein AYI69_g11447, partial [Smittium culicis]